MMKNQDKQYGLPAHMVALLSLTHKSNFHILADEKGRFISTHFNTTWNECSMYDGASTPGALFEEIHEALWFAPNFLWKNDLQAVVSR